MWKIFVHFLHKNIEMQENDYSTSEMPELVYRPTPASRSAAASLTSQQTKLDGMKEGKKCHLTGGSVVSIVIADWSKIPPRILGSEKRNKQKWPSPPIPIEGWNESRTPLPQGRCSSGLRTQLAAVNHSV
ncbi:hypothetical protein HNY73_004911 [Argiope bruennichi]|uniref:Uncharacterized protein n=1 Tax=Argiope bruennichi TaxID=94029 RepID=A0A8T0FUU2_ARGBR|nr:hypothetical protein HNY73_004911 [Argiope bruennichi]